jgi:hypothetical protein
VRERETHPRTEIVRGRERKRERKGETQNDRRERDLGREREIVGD